MQYHFHFLFLNPIFDQEFADEHHNGDESEDNIRFLWEDELVVEGNKPPVQTENGTFTLTAFKGRKKMTFEIPETRLIDIDSGSNQITRLAVTEDLIKAFDRKTEGDITRYTFHLGSMQEPHNPVKGIYISGYHFPVELTGQTED